MIKVCVDHYDCGECSRYTEQAIAEAVLAESAWWEKNFGSYNSAKASLRIEANRAKAEGDKQ